MVFHNAFKIEYGKMVNALVTSVFVDESEMTRKREPRFIEVAGLWDTGATCSVIVPKLAEHLNLIPIGKSTVIGVNSKEEANVYLIDLILPNNVYFPNVEIMGSNFSGGDMLIGMDIIQKGDFAISNGDGITHFSYCIPSHKDKTCLFEKSEKVNKR